MKTFKFLSFFIFGITILFVGCSDDQIDTANTQNKNPNKSHFCGYENYTFSDESEIEERQRRFREPAVNPCDISSLTISIDPCFDNHPVYIDAFEAAVDLFNEVPNCAVNITILPSGGEIHLNCFDEICQENEDILGGTAREFYDGTSDPELLININVEEMEECCGISFGLCELTGLIAHEIAHVIGVAHTEEPETGTYIEGTTLLDESSLFNGGSLCDGFCGFSFNDELALQILFPVWDVDEVSFSGPIDLCIEQGVAETATFCVSPMPLGISLYHMDGTPIEGNCFDLSYDAIGTYNVQVQMCNEWALCCEALSRSIVVFDGNCCASCYCECQELVEVTSIGPFSVYNGGNKKPTYRTVRHEIPCWDDTPCSELYPEGDELFDCERIVVNDDLELTITGDDVLCWDEEGIFCINGLPAGTDVDWDIEGPSGPVPYSSSGNCLVITFGEIGTFTVSTTICVNDCCQDFSHTVVNKECEEKCFCLCDYGDGDGTYEPVEMEIDCDEDCDEVFPEGDEYFDCKKIVREE